MAHLSYLTANHAFTPVSVRRAFDKPSPVIHSNSAISPIPPKANPATEKAKRDWPMPVRSYVQRAFATENNIPVVTRSEMEIKLKEIISDSAEQNSLSTMDWDNLLLPQQMIMRDRMIHVQVAPNPPLVQGVMPSATEQTNTIAMESTSKKRKSGEMDISDGDLEKIPPWRRPNNHNVFEDRVSFQDKRPRHDTNGKTSKSDHKLANRKRRFDDNRSTLTTNVRSPSPPASRGPVVGRCQTLEKKYFRLTSAPNPDTVRPLPILQKALEFLKKKWKTESNYSYICDQFKSLRQDLTVQHIKTDFTVNVYEIHARIALEKGDLGEYNQCQTQLRALYAQHLEGHPEEFKAYRILYFMHTCNRTDMNDVLADLTPVEKKDPSIKHALETRSALALGNYHRFFQLYLETPNMGAYLMDMFVTRERLVALSNICVS